MDDPRDKMFEALCKATSEKMREHIDAALRKILADHTAPEITFLKKAVALKEGVGLMTVTVQVGNQEWSINNYYPPDGGDGFKQCFRDIGDAFDRLNQKETGL